ETGMIVVVLLRLKLAPHPVDDLESEAPRCKIGDPAAVGQVEKEEEEAASRHQVARRLPEEPAQVRRAVEASPLGKKEGDRTRSLGEVGDDEIEAEAPQPRKEVPHAKADPVQLVLTAVGPSAADRLGVEIG